MTAARKRVLRLDRAVALLQPFALSEEEGDRLVPLPQEVDQAVAGFETALARDLDSPQAVARVFQLVRLAEAASRADQPDARLLQAIWMSLQRMDQVLGLLYEPRLPGTAAGGERRTPQQQQQLQKEKEEEEEEVRALAEQRWVSKQQRRFDEADALRERLRARGYRVQDTREGYVLSPLPSSAWQQ